MRPRLRPHAAALAALAIVALAAAPGAAQRAAQRARCDSVLSAATADSVTHTVSLTASAIDTLQGVPPSLVALVGQGVAQAFVTPRPLAMFVHQIVPPPASMEPQGYPVVNGDYVAVLHRDGRLDGAAVLASSLDRAFDRAVLDAVARVDSIGYRFPPPEAMAGDSALIRLRVDPYGVRDGASAPMFRARVPRPTFTEALVEGEGPAPRVPYSPEALASGARGMVTTWLVVDTAGVPIPQSVQVLRADHPHLLRMVLDAIPTLRYRPTRALGCGVPVHLVQRFDFAGYEPKASPRLTVAGRRMKSPPQRLDHTFPDIQVERVVDDGAQRAQPVLMLAVVIDEAGRPDLATLRVTGARSVGDRDEVTRWVAGGQYKPALDAEGRPMRAELAMRLGVAVRRMR